MHDHAILRQLLHASNGVASYISDVSFGKAHSCFSLAVKTLSVYNVCDCSCGLNAYCRWFWVYNKTYIAYLLSLDIGFINSRWMIFNSAYDYKNRYTNNRTSNIVPFFLIFHSISSYLDIIAWNQDAFYFHIIFQNIDLNSILSKKVNLKFKFHFLVIPYFCVFCVFSKGESRKSLNELLKNPET